MGIDIKRTIPIEHVGREGILKDENGKEIFDDSWLHPEVLNEEWEKSTNRNIKRLSKSVGLYIDLSKAMNTSKLVKKPVQVKGKDGKTFTRMQWVDPNTGQPSAQHNANQKAFIDEHVRQMSADDKYKHLEDHKLEWKHNDHPNILHKNKVEAVKQHLYDNPHLAGAEHLPKHENKSSEGTDRINEWVNGFAKNDREKLYNLMSKFGIAETDPKVADPDDKTHPIKHMRNMMQLKKYLTDNPHLMDDPDHQPNASSKPKPTSGSPTRAEKAGGSIDGVLKTLSRKELYSMMKQHGIAEVDPLEADPSDKVAPIKHMHNMVKLKKLVETNPHILNMDENFSTHAHEAERKEGMDEQQSRVQSVKDFMDSMSSDLKHSIADKYSDHPIMQNRIKSEHAHVDKMLSLIHI